MAFSAGHRWAVVCSDFQANAGKALVDELGPNAHFIKREIADYEDLAKVFTEVW